MRWRWLDWPAWARWVVTLAYAGLVSWLMFAPAATFREVHVWLAHQDKLAHLGIFLLLAALVRWSIPAAFERTRLRFSFLLALGAYAALIETLQPLVGGAGRAFEWGDMASNYGGVAAGWALMGWMVLGSVEECCEDHPHPALPPPGGGGAGA
jgi:hypothetical protein